MSTTNTSFEHVIHNIQERDRIIDESNRLFNTLLFHVQHNIEPIPRHTISQYSLNIVATRMNDLYVDYKQTLERFNIGIISFVSDYYSIVDQHSDQFHSRYLHTYSSHAGHYNPILLDNKATSSFDIEELIDIFKEHCYDLRHFKFHTDSSHQRRARERTWIIYQRLSNYIASESIYDLSDMLMHEIETITKSFVRLVELDMMTKNKSDDDERGMILINKLKHTLQQFKNIKLDFKPSEEMLDYCECGNVMQVMIGSSEMVCDHCGYLYELKGTVFDDNQFYSQEGTRYKHAGYEPSKHCRSWLERIQARETNTITETQLNKIEACIRRDGITNKKRLSIEQLRRYLKDAGLTELNEHVALIKRLITGVVPPQLSYSESMDITNSSPKR